MRLLYYMYVLGPHSGHILQAYVQHFTLHSATIGCISNLSLNFAATEKALPLYANEQNAHKNNVYEVKNTYV